MDEASEVKYRHNRKLLLRCVAGVLVIAFVTLLAQSFVNNVWSAWNIADGVEFQDYESFAEFMEQDIRGEYRYDQYEWAVDTVEPPGDAPIYYDQFGNEISEEEALTEEIRIADGTQEGKVVCTFIQRNESVISYWTADTEDGLPITVITQADYRAANRIVDVYNIGFAVLYGLEVLGALVFYLRKRMK